MFGFGGNQNVENDAYYEILGLKRSDKPSQLEIKQKYKKMMLRWHPDKNKDNEAEAQRKTQEINQANDVLKDERKRELYDKFGVEGVEHGGNGGGGGGGMHGFPFGGQGFPFSGQGFQFPGMNGNQQQKSKDDVEPIVVPVSFTLKQLYEGATVEKVIERQLYVDEHGKQATNVSVSCDDCGGNGMKTTVRRMGPMVQQITHPCQKCKGVGNMIDSKCKIIKKEIKLSIAIEAGRKNGDKILIQGKGHQNPHDTSKCGDIVIIIGEEEEENVRRKGNDLYVRQEISIFDALCGPEFNIDHISGKKLYVHCDELVKPGTIKVIKYYGMPIRGSMTRGNLYIVFDIKFPDSLTEKQKMAVMPFTESHQRRLDGKLNKDNPCMLFDPSDTMQDSDDEDGNGSDAEGGVQCAQQ
jgi:DnaJ homolog subfamily A member 2